MTDREALAALLHQRCKDDWERRFANGAVAVTQHGADAHYELSDYLIAAGVTLAPSPDEGLLAMVKTAARMGLCSQTHHEHLMLAARRALAQEGETPT